MAKADRQTSKETEKHAHTHLWCCDFPGHCYYDDVKLCTVVLLVERDQIILVLLSLALLQSCSSINQLSRFSEFVFSSELKPPTLCTWVVQVPITCRNEPGIYAPHQPPEIVSARTSLRFIVASFLLFLCSVRFPSCVSLYECAASWLLTTEGDVGSSFVVQRSCALATGSQRMIR